MMGVRFAGDSEPLSINIQSTAVAFVLAHPTFSILSPDNTAIREVVGGIRAHASFPALVRELEFSIKTEKSCPLEYACNNAAILHVNSIIRSLNLPQYK
jgi:hypothetical protein